MKRILMLVLRIGAATLVLAALTFALLWQRGWLPGTFAPKKLVLRGCTLTRAADVLALLDCDGTQAIPALWARSRKLAAGQRWLTGARVSSDWGRAAVLDVRERHPLLALTGGSAKYWLCDDGALVARHATDSGAPFDAIAQLLRIELPADPGAGALDAAPEFIQLAAACAQFLPGQIARTQVDVAGQLTLYDMDGFEIRLGPPLRLEERIAALPQVLRICAGHKDKLRYLDATKCDGTLVFYQKWKGDAKKLLAADAEGSAHPDSR